MSLGQRRLVGAAALAWKPTFSGLGVRAPHDGRQ
jgi:hypothetical protein